MTVDSKHNLWKTCCLNVNRWCHNIFNSRSVRHRHLVWLSLSRLSCRSLKTKTGGGDWPRASGWVSAASRRRWWSRSPEYWRQRWTGVNITHLRHTGNMLMMSSGNMLIWWCTKCCCCFKEYSVIRLLPADWTYCLSAVTFDLWPLNSFLFIIRSVNEAETKVPCAEKSPAETNTKILFYLKILFKLIFSFLFLHKTDKK